MKLSLYEQLRFFNKTQEEFARDLGVSLATAHRWVNNKTKPTRLGQRRIEEVLNAYRQEKHSEEEKEHKGVA